MPPDSTIPTASISTWQIILNIGSISGLIALVYTIFQSLQKRPKFKFDFSGQHGQQSREGSLDYYTFIFNGTLKNQSLDPNSINRISLVVWKNRNRNETLRFGHGGVSIQNRSTQSEVHLPIIFTPREAMALEIKCKFPITGTSDERLLSEFVPVQPGSQFLLPRHEYELVFEDVNENLYDQKGKLCNRKEIDLRWTLPNSTRTSRNCIYWPFIRHKLKILWSRIKFRWKIIFRSFGL
jgi:hypothetical protein